MPLSFLCRSFLCRSPVPRQSVPTGCAVGVLVALWVMNGTHAVKAQGVDISSQRNVAAVLRDFGRQWPESRLPHPHQGDTDSWKAYALSMKQLVAMGDKAVPGLIDGCSDDNYQVRALSARVLGYLQAEQSVPSLVKLLADTSAPVALLAADSLGQIQDPRGLDALRSARGSEKRGDVLLHINKSLDRDMSLEEDVVEQLLQISPDSIDSAKVGHVAPDFTLQDADGNSWTLSDQRAKKSVVLVFIYGDG